MQESNKTKRPDLHYEVMDVTQMTYPDDKFSVVLDKGTLDALMPDYKEGTIETVNKFFKASKALIFSRSAEYFCLFYIYFFLITGNPKSLAQWRKICLYISSSRTYS